MALSQRKITKSFIQHMSRGKSAEIAIHQIELEMEDVLNRKSRLCMAWIILRNIKISRSHTGSGCISYP